MKFFFFLNPTLDVRQTAEGLSTTFVLSSKLAAGMDTETGQSDTTFIVTLDLKASKRCLTHILFSRNP